MNQTWRVEVSPSRDDWDGDGRAVAGRIARMQPGAVTRVRTARIYYLTGRLDEPAVRRLAGELLADPVSDTFAIRPTGAPPPPARYPAVEVHPRPGVMDPVAASVELGIRDMGLAVDAVRTARRYELDGVRDGDELAWIAARVLSNDCIETTYVTGFGRADVPPWEPPRPHHAEFALRHVPLRTLDDDALLRLSREAHLFLSLDEMCAIRDYYRRLERDPTDLELETLAQTWSEHCVHKTLKSEIVYHGAPMPDPLRPEPINSGQTVELHYGNLLRDTIARATRTIDPPWCLSVFKDNAGIIAFDEEYGIAFKVETHNHPSAIEPYGGAATGVGGCIRDIMGCGLGARPIANTDVFCLAPPDWPIERLPTGVLHPGIVLDGVVAGVRDYGNRMGIPTVNGAIHFDAGYLGNPLVFVGCVGLIPRGRIEKAARPGDRIVLVGGRTGRDGIHGATFSSAELTDTHSDEFAHAVQIGNAITQKKMLDCILQARDHADGCLYSAITDCGAGGLSSAVGEMGAAIGARVELQHVPLKYEGLRYDEIWISEAQERMVLAVPPENVERLLAGFRAEDVEATVIGEFAADRRLTVCYGGVEVGCLDMHFLHEGLPRSVRQAEWRPAPGAARTSGYARPRDPVAWLLARLGDVNAASREWVIRQYDHEVQGGSVVKPLCGPGEGPADAAVLRPRLDSMRGIAIGCGLCPQLGDVDPYWMAVAAVDEALRNVVAVGGDPDRTAILDNFCWPKCDTPARLGELVRACQGAHDAALHYGLPFISGKDSLNNEFTMPAEDAARCGLPRSLAIPRTLLVSAVSVIDDVRRCVTAAARPANTISGGMPNTRAGEAEAGAGMSAAPPVEATLFYYVGFSGDDWSAVGLEARLAVHHCVARLIADGIALAVHDVGGEGIAAALAEMALAGRCGMSIAAHDSRPERDVFAPQASGYVVQVPESRLADFHAACLPEVPVWDAAVAINEPCIAFVLPDGDVQRVSLDEITRAWKTSWQR